MISMLRVACLGLVFAASAHADVPYFKWQQDSVYRVVKTHGCKTANVCVGMAERYYRGTMQGTEVVVCNSNGDACPSADACRAGTHELTTVDNPKLNDDGRRSFNPRQEWADGAPKKISKSAGCASPNVCYGKYENYWHGFAGSEKRGGGLAFCNADDNGNCKNITNCIADEDMMMDQHPDIAAKKRIGDGNGDGDNAKKKGTESDQT